VIFSKDLLQHSGLVSALCCSSKRVCHCLKNAEMRNTERPSVPPGAQHKLVFRYPGSMARQNVYLPTFCKERKQSV